MATELWFRNPNAYIRECAELLYPKIVWDRGLLRKKQIDGLQFVDLHYPSNVDFRVLLVGDQGTAELRRGYPMSRPYAVYPTWEFGEQTWDELEFMLANPVGDDTYRCKNRRNIPADETPVFGQEHRVVVIRWPDTRTVEGQAALRQMAQLQNDYPDAILHLHGSYSFRACFALGFAAADIEPREEAAKGRLWLGSGKSINFEQAPNFMQWVHLNGYSLGDLSVPRNRCLFNMRSAIWAAEHFNENINFRTRNWRVNRINPDDPEFAPTPTRRGVSRSRFKEGDRIACDSCSLQGSCKYYRSEGVCSIPESDMAELARYFKTRDSAQIIEGLGELMALQAERVEQGLENEAAGGSLDPEVTKIVNGMFANGVKLAKLVNPALAAASAPKIGVQINAGVAVPRPNMVAAAAVAELEARGIAREDITAEMVNAVMTGQPLAIEATASE